MTELIPFISIKDYFKEHLCRSGDQSCVCIDFNLREKFINEFGYIVPTAEAISVLVELLQPAGMVLDAGCGSGYLSKELSRAGVSTYSVDLCDYQTSGKCQPIRKSYQQDAIGDACSFISNKIGAVLLIWPPYNKPFALNIAQAMLPGQLLIYEGEDIYGCTANTEFFKFMEDSTKWQKLSEISTTLNSCHITFDGLNDCWTVWKRQ